MIDMIERFIVRFGDERKENWLKFHLDHLPWMTKAKGSGSNHQAWVGGYYHHIRECMSIARSMYNAFEQRQLPFTLGSAMIVLYFHDIEKMWKYTYGLEEDWDKMKFLEELSGRYKFGLSVRERHAIYYIHGEGDEYCKDKRVMGRLGAFVHSCDILSARLWHNWPPENERELPTIL